ncbi:lipopolysaccharide export system permease protein [Fluviicoccus keumensis]|uniref:Lipopolysaccharide export system permease protein n=1 Tax=Fluviicoccus keumensis TaxID=1435465 RepID=A0A4Q7ZBU7_9GAMM|nr:LPS export ABC transporter permease LptG [Fluviicoccus keumensis]RZU47601.1 lipopolysaccharide export system permease protein [Fluviicoccus keumensis]
MNLLPMYVSRTVLFAMLLVLFLLLGLDLVFSFIAEMEEIKGNYQALQALQVVALELPYRLCDILPVSGLVGGIIGLGLLASQSELTVMRASGVSVGRIVWWTMRPALALVMLGLLVAQYGIPVSNQKSETIKARALGQDYHAGFLSGFWHREGNDFIHMQQVEPGGRLHAVTFYRLSQDGRLTEMTGVREGKPLSTGGWRLQGVYSVFLGTDGAARAGSGHDFGWKPELTPDFLRLVTVSPEYLPLTSLYSYARYLEGQGLGAGIYFLEFWKKALAPLATLSMVLIACTFIFGPLRSVTMGLRIVTGVLAGLGFRYLQDICGYASLVYDFSPLLAVLVPVGLSLGWGLHALRRVR